MTSLRNLAIATALLALMGCATAPTGSSLNATEGGAGGQTVSAQPASSPVASAPQTSSDEPVAMQGGPNEVDCTAVLCAPCPEGRVPRLKSPNCCQCVPVRPDPPVTDCSNVRCAECPEGERPALHPPDCCRCLPAPPQ